MNHSDFGAVFNSGIDYLTVTTSIGDDKTLMTARGLRSIRQEETQGNDLCPWSMLQFEGYKCGSIQLGEGDGRTIVRVSGELASDQWRRFGELAENCSRLDMQVTVRFSCEAMKAISRVYRQTKRNRHADGKTRTISLLSSTNGSATIYVGQRSSENYGRVYAKGMETKLPYWENSVRFEAEFKGNQALTELRRVLSAKDHTGHVVRRVREFFAMRGIICKWSSIDGDGLTSAEQGLLAEKDGHSRRNLSDSERRLRWLETSVRGTVQALIADGRYHETMVALGLRKGGPGDAGNAPLIMDHATLGGE